MFHGQSAHQLGYANSAILVAFLRTLVKENALTERMAEDVCRDAIKILRPGAATLSIAEAIQFIEDSFFDALWKSQKTLA